MRHCIPALLAHVVELSTPIILSFLLTQIPLFYYLLFRDHLVDVCPCGLEDFKKYFLGGRTTTSERDRATPEACRSRNSRCLRARGRCRVEQICHMGGFASWSGFMYLDDITLVSRQGLPTHRLCTMARNPSSSYVLFHASTDTQ